MAKRKGNHSKPAAQTEFLGVSGVSPEQGLRLLNQNDSSGLRPDQARQVRQAAQELKRR